MENEMTEEDFLKHIYGSIHSITKHFLEEDEKRVSFILGSIASDIHWRLKEKYAVGIDEENEENKDEE